MSLQAPAEAGLLGFVVDEALKDAGQRRAGRHQVGELVDDQGPRQPTCRACGPGAQKGAQSVYSTWAKPSMTEEMASAK